jgi:hypothetical protein
MKRLICLTLFPILIPYIYRSGQAGHYSEKSPRVNERGVFYAYSSKESWSMDRAVNADSTHPKQITFHFRKTQVLFNANDLNGRKYCAFPSTIKLNDTTVLIAYKRGYAHYKDTGIIGLIRYNPVTNKVISNRPIYETKFNNQNPEILQMPNGDVVVYVDRQTPGNKERMGLVELRSSDHGMTWKDKGVVGLIDGIEYGYAFDDYIEGNTVYVLWMTFPELKGSGGKRSVHVLKSTDNGKSWTDVKDLTATFGKAFNECTLEKYHNKFLIVGRLDEKSLAMIFETDNNFNLIKQLSLSSVYSCIGSIGRPKLFIRDGSYYFISRNNGYLFFYRINPKTLEIEKYAKLYKKPGRSSGDAHYAEPYFQQRDDKTYLNVIDYFPVTGPLPEIVRFEYKWADFR